MSFEKDFPDGEVLEYFSWFGEQISREEWMKKLGVVIAARADKTVPLAMTHNYSGDVRLVPAKPPTFCERVASLFRPD